MRRKCEEYKKQSKDKIQKHSVLPAAGDFKQFVGKELRARFPQTPSAGFVQAAPWQHELVWNTVKQAEAN